MTSWQATRVFAGTFILLSLALGVPGSPLFVSLRDANNLHDKCGRCDYRELCGLRDPTDGRLRAA